MKGATENARPDIAGPSKLWGLTTRDWTTRHHIARVDIARLVSVFEYMLTTSLYLIQGILYEVLIGFMLVVLFICVLLIATCGRLRWSALWTTFGRTIK